LCFPLIAVCLRESSRRKILATVTLAVLLPVLLTRMGIPAAWKPVHHLADFLLGIAAAGVYEMLAESNIGLLRNGAWLYAPAAAIGTIFVVYAEQVSRAVDLNSALRPVYALLIIGLAVGGGAPARLLSTRFATHLGQASYSLYILHIPLLWWYKRFWLNPQTASALIYLVGVVMISGAVFQWVEEPANRRIRQWERDKANQKAKIFRSVGTIAQLAAGVENPQREESSPRNTFAF